MNNLIIKNRLAHGILIQIVNLLNCDHVTVKQFHKRFSAESVLEVNKNFIF